MKNILAGSFKAMLRDARLIDHLLDRDPFEGVSWPRVEVPGPDPFTGDERHRILEWFRERRFGFHAGRGSMERRLRPHPPFHVFFHVLFWTGMRPSEVAGLRWGDLDLERGVLQVARSRHLYEDSAPKTPRSQRTVKPIPWIEEQTGVTYATLRR